MIAVFDCNCNGTVPSMEVLPNKNGDATKVAPSRCNLRGKILLLIFLNYMQDPGIVRDNFQIEDLLREVCFV